MFIVDLWDSVFTPGATPALVLAMHVSFVLLLVSLLLLIAYTRNIHFINLFVIAFLLYMAVVWFVAELKSVKLKSNAELERESADPESPTKTNESPTRAHESPTRAHDSADNVAAATPGAPRKRKT